MYQSSARAASNPLSLASVMPDSDEHEDDVYEDEELELSDDDPPVAKVWLSVN